MIDCVIGMEALVLALLLHAIVCFFLSASFVPQKSHFKNSKHFKNKKIPHLNHLSAANFPKNHPYFCLSIFERQKFPYLNQLCR